MELYMGYIGQVIFLLCLIGAGYFLQKRILRIRNAIRLGKPEDRSDNPSERLKMMLRVAFGQQKMFKKPLVGFMHFLVYIGFIIINIEILEIILDGLLGTHRLFAPYLGGFYPFMIGVFEFLALGVIIACTIFLIRRNVLKLRRFRAYEITRWPRTDANVILISEIILMIAFLTWNASDTVLQQRQVGHYAQVNAGPFLFSQFLMPLFSGWSDTALIAYERFAWWAHILGILAFSIYITYSKHLHIFIGFPNTYFSRLSRKGKIRNMPVVTNEVRMMLGIPADSSMAAEPEAPQPASLEEIGRFGAKDINDLTWKNLMDAYSCTECGRCTEACPANITGKKLSPRKIMMDTRDRAEEVSRSIDAGRPGLNDGKALIDDYISREELLACTTCNACVEACPVNINPLDIIIDLRRFMAMEDAKVPNSWNAMFSNIENNMAPWKFSPADRFNWAENLNTDGK